MKNRKRFAAFVLATVLWAASLMGCAGKSGVQETDNRSFGIDVAKYQGIIDWSQVSESGVDFAMVRVGYRTKVDGEIREDPTARYNLQEASKAGIQLGVYFFSTAVTQEEAVEEADWVAKLIASYPITYPVVYDCEDYSAEDSRQNHLSKQERTDIALAFLAEIEKHGYQGMFYSSRNEMHEEKQWEVSRIEPNYKIWVAQYPELPYPLTDASTYLGTHHMWQYSRSGKVAGIPEDVDMNVAYFSYKGIAKPHNKKMPEVLPPDLDTLMDFRTVDEQVTAKVSTNLRNLPSQDDNVAILFTLQNGQVARRIGYSSTGWSKLEYEGLVCYAVSSYLTTDLYGGSSTNTSSNGDGIETQFTPVNYLVTAKDKVNLRRLPSVEREDAKVVAQLVKGDTATCVGVSDNGWAKLEYNGMTCYAVFSYLEQLSDSSAAPETKAPGDIETVFEAISDKVTAKQEVNLRKKPSVQDKDAVVVAKLTHGEIVERTGINRDVGWSRVVYNGEVLYCVSSYLEVVG